MVKINKVATAIFVALFSAIGIQSSYADYYPSGIQQNVSEQTLRDNGWTLFYEQTYSTRITSLATELQPNGQYVILTGKSVGSSTLPILAAAPTSQVFTQTVRNNPQLLNGAYWYFTDGIAVGAATGSIGYAPTSTINQNEADVTDSSDPLRLSWHLGCVCGGYRLGNIITNESTDYLKQVWTWNGISTTPAPVYVRQTSNLTFAQSLYASDTLSDPDGQLRKTVDQIMLKHGSLIK